MIFFAIADKRVYKAKVHYSMSRMSFIRFWEQISESSRISRDLI